MNNRDLYDEGIAYLTQHPDKIRDAWGEVGGTSCGQRGIPLGARALFQFCGSQNRNSGCLTQVRSGGFSAQDPPGMPPEFLEDAIVADTSLPMEPEDIEVRHLERFAEWQRYLDELFPGVDRGLGPK